MLQATDLNRKIAGKDILKRISLSVAPGEIACVIGPSGAGKTSLLRAISLLDRPDSGAIVIGNTEYCFPSERKMLTAPYPNLTIVFQQLFIWPHLTIRENITLPLKGDVDTRHFEEVVASFQMKEFLDRYPNEVSVGQKQRAALARALLLKPTYLLLDEVTSALDIEQAHLILSHLKEIAAKGVAIVLATHALHFAGKISNKVIFLDEGEVVESGSSEILTKPKTERLRKFIGAAEQVV